MPCAEAQHPVFEIRPISAADCAADRPIPSLNKAQRWGDLVIPMPLHKQESAERGCNQADSWAASSPRKSRLPERGASADAHETQPNDIAPGWMPKTRQIGRRCFPRGASAFL